MTPAPAARTLLRCDRSSSTRSRLRFGDGADTAAPGGAVTVSLCGHWDHDGPCRWPHHSRVHAANGDHVLRVVVVADDDELDGVRERIEAAVGAGALTGPDGRTTTWTVVSCRAAGPQGNEIRLAEHLQNT